MICLNYSEIQPYIKLKHQSLSSVSLVSSMTPLLSQIPGVFPNLPTSKKPLKNCMINSFIQVY